jgi:hypothetical protein
MHDMGLVVNSWTEQKLRVIFSTAFQEAGVSEDEFKVTPEDLKDLQ